MMSPLCDLADDYVMGELPGSLRDDFESHLLTCSECRNTVHLDHEIDRLLKLSNKALPTPAHPLVEVAAQRIDREVVKSRVLASLWVLVPTILFMLLLWRGDPVETPGSPDIVKAHPEPLQRRLGPDETFISTKDPLPQATTTTHVAVEVATKNPKVQILWFYPTAKSTKELPE